MSSVLFPPVQAIVNPDFLDSALIGINILKVLYIPVHHYPQCFTFHHHPQQSSLYRLWSFSFNFAFIFKSLQCDIFVIRYYSVNT